MQNLSPWLSKTTLDYPPKLEQIIRAFEFIQIEMAVCSDRGYAQGRGVGQPEAGRRAPACAFLAKAALDLKTTRALIERIQADSKLRRLCGFGAWQEKTRFDVWVLVKRTNKILGDRRKVRQKQTFLRVPDPLPTLK